MECKAIRLFGSLLLIAVLGGQAIGQVWAQTAVSTAQVPTAGSAQAPSGTNQSQAFVAPADSEKPKISRAEMIHRTLFAIYDKLENHDSAAAELDELMRLKPSEAVFPFYYGQLLAKDGKWNDALARFEFATKLDPELSNAYCGMGDCQMKLRQYKEAVVSYSLASQHAKAGQDFSGKVAIAKQWQERKQQEDAYAAALKKLSAPATRSGAKKH